MSKPKASPIETQAQIVQANIRSRCAYFNCTTEETISERIGMPRTTYHIRKHNPKDWTVEEITMAAIALKVPFTWLVSDHSVITEVDT